MTAVVVMPPRLSSAELDELAFAARCLGGGGFAARLAERLGRSVEMISRNLPPSLRRLGGRAAERALRAALAVALKTIDHGAPAKAARGSPGLETGTQLVIDSSCVLVSTIVE